jgi:hypothetical protein
MQVMLASWRRTSLARATGSLGAVAAAIPRLRRDLEGDRLHLTSSIALKDEDPSRNRWSRCRFAVHRPGRPVASPRSHGTPCRGVVLGSERARLAVAGNSTVPYSTDTSGEVKRRALPGPRAGVSTPRSR